MRLRDITPILFLVLTAVVVVDMAAHPVTNTKPWTEHAFVTHAEMTAYLNSLPPDVADSAKFVPMTSNRNILGWVGKPYIIVCRCNPEDEP